MSFSFSSGGPQPPRQPTLPKGFSLIAIVAWTALAAIAYFGIDALLVWLLANGGQLAETGRNIGTVVGAEVDPAVEALGIGGLWEQGLALLRMLLLPLTILVWLIGAVVLLVLPRIIGKLFGMASQFRR